MLRYADVSPREHIALRALCAFGAAIVGVRTRYLLFVRLRRRLLWNDKKRNALERHKYNNNIRASS